MLRVWSFGCFFIGFVAVAHQPIIHWRKRFLELWAWGDQGFFSSCSCSERVSSVIWCVKLDLICLFEIIKSVKFLWSILHLQCGSRPSSGHLACYVLIGSLRSFKYRFMGARCSSASAYWSIPFPWALEDNRAPGCNVVSIWFVGVDMIDQIFSARSKVRTVSFCRSHQCLCFNLCIRSFHPRLWNISVSECYYRKWNQKQSIPMFMKHRLL